MCTDRHKVTRCPLFSGHGLFLRAVMITRLLRLQLIRSLFSKFHSYVLKTFNNILISEMTKFVNVYLEWWWVTQQLKYAICFWNRNQHNQYIWNTVAWICICIMNIMFQIWLIHFFIHIYLLPFGNNMFSQ